MSNEVKKVIRDGKVAVLVSPGFGAGWSTWAKRAHKDWALFSPEVVAYVEGGFVGDLDEIVDTALGCNSGFYSGGVSGLQIEWIPVGTQFRVEEYDGSESIVTHDENYWSIA